ncbi:MAG: class I lanthipeptide [Chitinophagaceae bacterium]|nr:class I lanthipeptide [Chitinophagaceae bacterium]
MNKKTLLTAENAQSETPGKNKLVLNKRTIVKFSEKQMQSIAGGVDKGKEITIPTVS